MDFDTAVKLNIYETIARTTQAPTTLDVAQGLGAVNFEGKMIDIPVVERARKLLARHDAIMARLARS